MLYFILFFNTQDLLFNDKRLSSLEQTLMPFFEIMFWGAGGG